MMKKSFLVLLVLMFSIGAVQASDGDCNTLMKSRWESSLNDLAELRIDLDLQRASGSQSSIARALENAYALKFNELLATSHPTASAAQLELLVKEKIQQTQGIAKAPIADVSRPIMPGLPAPKAVLAESSVLETITWSLRDGDWMKKRDGKILFAAKSESDNAVISILIDPKSYAIESRKMAGFTNTDWVQFLDENTVLVRNGDRIRDFDLKTGDFTVSTEIPNAVKQATSKLGEKVYISGGTLYNEGIFDHVSVLDLSTREYKPFGTLKVARMSHQQVVLPDGKILVIGGSGMEGEDAKLIEMIDPVAGTVGIWGTLAEERENFTATILPNGKIAVVGGALSIEIIDVAAKKVETIGVLPHYIDRQTTTVLPDGRLLISGGQDERQYDLSEIYLINPVSGFVNEVGALVEARKDHHQILTSDNEILVLGGFSRTFNMRTIEKIILKEQAL